MANEVYNNTHWKSVDAARRVDQKTRPLMAFNRGRPLRSLDTQATSGEGGGHLAVSGINRIGWICLILAIVLFGVSYALRCSPTAAPVALVCYGSGTSLGFALAMVTRTRRPLAIYLWLATASVTILPLLFAWPPGDELDVSLWRGAPGILSNYFEILRGAVYLLAVPYPFARLGHHGPDLPPTDPHGNVR